MPSLQSSLVALAAALLLWAAAGRTMVAVTPDRQEAGPAPANVLSRNLVNLRERNLPTNWLVDPENGNKNIKWSTPVGTNTFGSPVVSGGRIFVATNNERPRDPRVVGKKAVLMALREGDGTFLWQIAHDCPKDDIFCPGDRYLLMSTPAVDGGQLYYSTPLGEVICAACATGKILWRYHPLKDLTAAPYYRSAASPLVVGDLVFVMTGNCADEEKPPAPKAPSFIALDKNTGKLVWESNLPGANIIAGQWSSPAYAVVNNRPLVLFGGGDGVLYGFDPPTGKLLWRCDCLPAPKQRAPGQIANHFVGAPVVVGTRVYVGLGVTPEHVGTPRTSWFLCLDLARQGDVSLKSYNASGPENKDSALVWAFGGPVQPKPAVGRQQDFGPTASTAAVHDGLVYISEINGYLHCLDAATGQRHWQADLRASIHGSQLWADGKIYVGSDDGQVFVYAHGTKLTLIDANEMDEVIHSTPVAANGVIYVLTRDKLHAISPR